MTMDLALDELAEGRLEPDRLLREGKGVYRCKAVALPCGVIWRSSVSMYVDWELHSLFILGHVFGDVLHPADGIQHKAAEPQLNMLCGTAENARGITVDTYELEVRPERLDKCGLPHVKLWDELDGRQVAVHVCCAEE